MRSDDDALASWLRGVLRAEAAAFASGARGPDPAALERLLDYAEAEEEDYYGQGTLWVVASHLALAYAHMPGYRQEWKP